MYTYVIGFVSGPWLSRYAGSVSFGCATNRKAAHTVAVKDKAVRHSSGPKHEHQGVQGAWKKAGRSKRERQRHRRGSEISGEDWLDVDWRNLQPRTK